MCTLAFAPDGLSLVCGDFGRNARIFAYDGNLKSPTALPRFGDAVRHSHFSPDGNLLGFWRRKTAKFGCSILPFWPWILAIGVGGSCFSRMKSLPRMASIRAAAFLQCSGSQRENFS